MKSHHINEKSRGKVTEETVDKEVDIELQLIIYQLPFHYIIHII